MRSPKLSSRSSVAVSLVCPTLAITRPHGTSTDNGTMLVAALVHGDVGH